MRDFLKIINLLNPIEFVTFDHNPERFKLTRRLKGDGKTTALEGEGAGVQNRGANPTKITLTNARLVGPETKRYCDVLFDWLNADSTLLQPGLLGKRMPVLHVQWGPPAAGLSMKAILTNVTISYERVSAAGIPTVALVSLMLKEERDSLTLTNPTSGGRPGRNRHVVSSDESLMSIAASTFGDPNAWRAIAKVNNIDDPSQLHPGAIVYLPAVDELKQLAKATS